MGVPQVGIEPQRKLQFRDGRAIFGVLEVSISEAGVADRGIRLQLSYFAELLNRHIQPALLRRRRPGLCVLDDFRSKTLQKKTAGEERGSHDLPKSESSSGVRLCRRRQQAKNVGVMIFRNPNRAARAGPTLQVKKLYHFGVGLSITLWETAP